jgi:hypothetical protein
VAIIGTVTTFVFARDLDRRLAGQPPAVRQAMRAQASKLAEAKPPKGADVNEVHRAVQESFVAAFRVNALGAAALAALSAAGALAVERRRRSKA